MAALWPVDVVLLWLCCGWVSGLLASSPFTLEGSQSSYAQFRKWNAGLNGTLELEFRTDQPNGLLLYTDDGGTFDFFELKLVEGALRLRYNLGGGAQIITSGRNLSDSRWHKAEIRRSVEQTSLTVDHVTVTRTSRGREFVFGNVSTNSLVYVGGLPTWYGTKLTQLALPSVMFEPRYRGAVRNLIYADLSGGPRQQDMMASKVGNLFSSSRSRRPNWDQVARH
jgi:neurexin